MHRRSFLASALGILACGSESSPTSARPSSAGAAAQTSNLAQQNSLRLLSYNVLADPVHLGQRLPVLFREMQDAQADVIALQEVAPWFLEVMEREQWAREYSFCQVGGRGADRGGQAFLSKVDVRNPVSVVLAGRQQRTALLVDVDVGGQALVVATTHLESFLEDGPTRAAQLDVTFRALNRSPLSDRVLCGDLNFGEGEEPDTAHLDPSYVDVWNALHPGEAGYTWDIDRSEMARVSSFVGEGSRRLDRVLLKSEEWRGVSIEIVGDSPVTPDRRLFPSDHFGILCELRRV